MIEFMSGPDNDDARQAFEVFQELVVQMIDEAIGATFSELHFVVKRESNGVYRVRMGVDGVPEGAPVEHLVKWYNSLPTEEDEPEEEEDEDGEGWKKDVQMPTAVAAGNGHRRRKQRERVIVSRHVEFSFPAILSEHFEHRVLELRVELSRMSDEH